MVALDEYSPLPPWQRTSYCGALRAADAGREVALWGWVSSRRDHGGLIFIDLRDREAVRSTLDAVRKNLGPIRGLIHGAGVLADRRVEDLTDNALYPNCEGRAGAG